MKKGEILKMIGEQDKVDDWNKKYSIGQPVTVPGSVPTAPRIATRTTSRALMLNGRIAGVYCGELRGFFPLDSMEIFKT
jgi:hypothetical protein